MGVVLVTGAGGFAGRAVVSELRRSGYRVRAAVRGSIGGDLGADEVIALGDIGDPIDCGAVVADAEAVVHLAARVHVSRETSGDPFAEFQRVNTHGTARLAATAARAGVRRFVYVSSIGVNGDRSPGRPFTEEDVPRPHSPYARSKWEGENALRRISAETGLGVVILRPPMMYGPGAKGNCLALLRAVARGWPLPLGSIENSRSFLFVGNLASAIRRSLEVDLAGTVTFLISDGEDVSTPEFVRRLARSLERRPRLLPCPVPLLFLAGALVGKSRQVRQLVESLRIDASRIRRQLDWTPPYAMADGLRAMAQWYRHPRVATG